MHLATGGALDRATTRAAARWRPNPAAPNGNAFPNRGRSPRTRQVRELRR